jgi:Tfp pilus assembly protein PilV
VTVRRPCPGTAAGFGMVELVVAMTLLAVGVLGLVAAATVAARAIHGADERERAARAVATLADSLLAAAAPAAGERLHQDVPVRWSVGGDSALLVIDIEVELDRPGVASRRVRYRAARLR